MEKRKLRIVRDHPLLGICEYCNMQFSCGLMPVEAAREDIQERFNVHKCKPVDSSQNALRLVREPTEGKKRARALRTPLSLVTILSGCESNNFAGSRQSRSAI